MRENKSYYFSGVITNSELACKPAEEQGLEGPSVSFLLVQAEWTSYELS